MKRIKILAAALFGALTLTAVLASTASANAPIFKEEYSFKVSETSAYLHMKIDPNGNTSTGYLFNYDTDGPYYQYTTAMGTYSGTGIFEVNQQITGLRPGTTYYFEGAAFPNTFYGGTETAYGEMLSFTTYGPTTLCKVAEPLAACATSDRYPAGTTIEATLTEGSKATLESSLGTVTCTGSGFKAATETEERPLINVAEWSLSGCNLGKVPCTATADASSYAGDISAAGNENGSIEVRSNGSGSPGWTINCGSAIQCTFSNVSGLTILGGTQPELTGATGELTRSGSFCPSTSKFNMTYRVTTPQPLYVHGR